MQQLTRNEIIELRARVIYKYFTKYKPVIKPAEPNKRALMVEVLAEFDELNPSIKEHYLSAAQATIEADEKAGVLMLVEKTEPRDGDLVEYQRHNGGLHIGYDIKKSTGAWVNDIHVREIIKRDNTPVYQCKKDNEGVK